MKRAAHLAIAAALTFCNFVDAEVYLTPEDELLVKDSKASVEERCAEDLTADIDRDEAHQTLLDALGGDNFVLDALKESNDGDEFVQLLQDSLSPTFFLEKTLAIATGFTVLLCCMLCWCWTACPCCRWCRICERKRKKTKIFKLGVGALMGVCAVLVIVGIATTVSGTSGINDGFDSVVCAGSELLDTTLSGKTEPYFIGMMPALGVISDLDKELDSNSNLLFDIEGLLCSTKAIEESVQLASRTLGLLGQMLSEPKTIRPETAGTGDLMHECALCENLAVQVVSASEALSTSVAGALVEARSVVRERLSEGERQKLQNQLRESASPLVQLKDQVSDAFEPFVRADSFIEDIDTYLDSYLLPVTGFLAALSVLFLIFGIVSVLCWCCCETTWKDSERVYSRGPPCLACCTMCCAIPCFVFPAFVLGGLLMGVFVATSSACDTLVQFDAGLIQDFSRVTGSNVSAEIFPLIDACIAGYAGPNPNVMDLILIQMNESQPKEAASDVLRRMIYEPLEGAFEGIDAAVEAAGNASIDDNDAVRLLRSLLSQNGVDSMMLADGERIMAAYPQMFAEEALNAAAVTSSSCDDHSVGDASSQTIRGVQYFVDALSAFGAVVADLRTDRATDCTVQVACNGTSPAACQEGNEYLLLKRQVIESDIYRCDVFEDVNGTACDPLGMTEVNGVWEGDCLIANSDGSKSMIQKRVDCNLVEFTAYVRDFDSRIEKVMARVASTTDLVLRDISIEMHSILEDRILQPVDGILGGITCGFLINGYRKVIDGFCYQTAIGLSQISRSYMLFGSSILIMSLALYFAWRIEIDNINVEADCGKRRPSSSE